MEPGADLPLAEDPASRGPGVAPRAEEHLPGDLRPELPAGTGDFHVPADPAPPPASASRPRLPRGAGPRDMTMIDERPPQADDRVQAGHWESH